MRTADPSKCLVIFALLAGCFAPAAPSGVPCDPLAPSCPLGQQCVLEAGAYACSTGDGDEPPPPEMDEDGDGIASAFDLCPSVFDPRQSNHDGDRFGDACDPCPPVADDAPPDLDGDGVADACDPQPSIVGDRIAFFTGFDHVDDWHATGDWIVAAGGATASTRSGEEARLTVPAPRTGRVTVTTSFLVSSLNGALAYSGAGLIDLRQGEGGIACHAYRSGLGYNHLGLIDTSREAALATAGLEFDEGQRYTTTLTRAASRYECRGVHAGIEKMAMTDVTGATTVSEVGVRVHSLTATFDWLLVVVAD